MDVVTAGTKTNERKLTYLSHDQKQSHPFLGMFTLPEDAILVPFDEENYPNHEGIDFYGQFKEDIKLFAEMGFNGYRMSISWSRIFPNGDDDQPNEEGLKFYDAIFDELLNYKIQPIVTISHYETPLALVNKWNGWADRRTIDCFMKYCQVILIDTKIKSNTG